MRFYADVSESRSSLDILEELNGLARQLTDPCSARIPDQARGIARDGLILSGMLEQAVADNPDLNSWADPWARAGGGALEAQTDWWADRLCTPSDVAIPPRPSLTVPDVRLTVVIPEGYLFYALFPEFYAQAGMRMAKESTVVRYVVVGVRSIGTSLSAAFAAGLRAAGCTVTRHTVRPMGDPFSREVVVSRDVQAGWREATERGASFVAVDEGPGLSGSSLTAVVRAFHRAGVAREQAAIVCAHPPGALPHAGSEVERMWQATRYYAVEAAGERMLLRCLPTLLGSVCDATLRLDRDLSWGGWREEGAPLLPDLERRKFLLRDQTGGGLLAKFVGFGAWGALKARSTSRIAGRGEAPPVRGYAHGFLVQAWGGRPGLEGLRDRNRSETLEAAAMYYAGLRRDADPSGDSLDPAELIRTVEDVGSAWFGGTTFANLGAMSRLAAASSPMAFAGDQRPEPVEWRRWGSGLVKCDTADHFLDHSWARRQDIAFDLAGFMDEWQLSTPERERFMAAYIWESGDGGAPHRLPFFRCVYHAHRLAMLDTAYHAGMDSDDAAVAGKRQAEGELLAAALGATPVAPCD